QKHAPKDVKFFDAGSNVFNAIIAQLNPAYYDSHGKVIVGSNAKVKAAWDVTMKGVQGKQTAGLAAFSNDWNTGYKKGTFATVTCPAWMMGYIQGQAPKSKGKWDIAAVPGGGGNWGGSFLTVPKQSCQPKLLKSKAVLAFKNPFFSNAPVGKIFGTSAMKLKPQILGPHQGDIQTASTN